MATSPARRPARSKQARALMPEPMRTKTGGAPMKHLLEFSIALIAMGIAAAANAQNFPDRPVKVIIPYAPGGGTDNLVRTIAPTISASMGQPLVIENRPGG